MNSLFQTERLYFRHMKHDDMDCLLSLFQDEKVMAYYPSKKNRRDTLEWIEWTLKNYRSYGIGLWILELKEEREFIGQCGLVPKKIDGKVEIEIGYLLAQKYWNKGLATEAASACLRYGLHDLSFNRIVSLIDQSNLPSIRVAEKIGMTFEKNVSKWEKTLRMYSISKNHFLFYNEKKERQ
ncbi:GNAT family N-acetyltransferase [Priestia abyssalis]|uniref:GNAT family N-acetyltransferase n=1 Tax=Priestia abyssalis TaxID=1221450 RepID=UPI000995103A|nr:GNAT family N-acetyltransferase [Priestia abyssalis]